MQGCDLFLFSDILQACCPLPLDPLIPMASGVVNGNLIWKSSIYLVEHCRTQHRTLFSLSYHLTQIWSLHNCRRRSMINYVIQRQVCLPHTLLFLLSCDSVWAKITKSKQSPSYLSSRWKLWNCRREKNYDILLVCYLTIHQSTCSFCMYESRNWTRLPWVLWHKNWQQFHSEMLRLLFF